MSQAASRVAGAGRAAPVTTTGNRRSRRRQTRVADRRALAVRTARPGPRAGRSRMRNRQVPVGDRTGFAAARCGARRGLPTMFPTGGGRFSLHRASAETLVRRESGHGAARHSRSVGRRFHLQDLRRPARSRTSPRLSSKAPFVQCRRGGEIRTDCCCFAAVGSGTALANVARVCRYLLSCHRHRPARVARRCPSSERLARVAGQLPVGAGRP